jgi:hypothetical protein
MLLSWSSAYRLTRKLSWQPYWELAGFIHAGINPTQIISALSASSRGEIVVSRKLLEEFLSEIGLREDLILTSRQREILELLAEAATPEGGVVMPRKLLEASLMEVLMT